MPVKRSKLRFSFLVFWYSCKKAAPKKKENKNGKQKEDVETKLIRPLQKLEAYENKELDQRADQAKFTRKQFRGTRLRKYHKVTKRR